MWIYDECTIIEEFPLSHPLGTTVDMLPCFCIPYDDICRCRYITKIPEKYERMFT